MTAEKGSAFLLKVGDGNLPVNFSTVAGLRTTSVSINSEVINITNKGSSGWRELLGGAGIRSVNVTGAGIFTNSTSEQRLKAKAFSGELDDYQLVFESGEYFRGRFQLSKLDYSGDYNGERTYSLTLESSGAVVFSS